MQVSFSWLKEYLDLSQNPESIAEVMSSSGLEVEKIEHQSEDVIFTIGLTPNLGHCMSVIGIARELSALLQIPVQRKKISFQESGPLFHVPIHIENQSDCSHYCCKLAQGVTIGSSPSWIVKKLHAAGIRSVNAVVDIGNLVMLECGQPLHMFDWDSLNAKEIRIKTTQSPVQMQTLDQVERTIPPGVLVVCCGEEPIAIAGVMGEASSAVSKKTKNVLIEAALFSPVSVRKSAKILGLRSESSLRFERGLDSLGVRWALDMAAALLQEVAGASIAKGVSELNLSPYHPRQIRLNPQKANRLLGLNLSVHEICLLLGRLEIEILQDSADKIQVAVPSYRNDLIRDVDLIEEIGRIYGLSHIPRTRALHISSKIPHTPTFVFEEEVRQKLVELGLQECLTCNLISPKMAQVTLERELGEKAHISVLHPSSVDQSILRPSLLPGLLSVAAFNLDRQNKTIYCFEVGHIHFKSGETFFEQAAAGILLTGLESPYHFEKKPKETDFFHLKGLCENLLLSLGIDTFSFIPSHLRNFHPGRQARCVKEDIILGAIGEIHPHHLREIGISQRVYYAEFNLSELMQIKRREIHVQPLPSFPGSERDWTVPIAENISVGAILEEVQKLSSPILEKAFLLDIYQDQKERKNVTLRFTYRDIHRTLSYEEIEKEHRRLLEHLAEKFSIV